MIYRHYYIPSFPAHWAQMAMKPSAAVYVQLSTIETRHISIVNTYWVYNNNGFTLLIEKSMDPDQLASYEAS